MFILYQGEPIRDPFRKTLAHAVQWHGVLRMRIERAAEAAVHRVKEALALGNGRTEARDAETAHVEDTRTPVLSRAVQLVLANRSPSNISQSKQNTPKNTSSCAFILQDRCPACFGGSKFGQHPSLYVS